jgi:hypothetical protein
MTAGAVADRGKLRAAGNQRGVERAVTGRWSRRLRGYRSDQDRGQCDQDRRADEQTPGPHADIERNKRIPFRLFCRASGSVNDPFDNRRISL